MTSRTVVHITDMHVVAQPGAKVKAWDTKQSLQRVLDDVKTRFERIDAIVLTGDLVHDEGLDAYRILDDMMAGVAEEIYCIPGNHDDVEVMEHYFGDSHRNVDYVRYAQVGAWQFVFLDSSVSGEVKGRIREEDYNALHTLLESTTSPTAIYLHHPVVPVNANWLDRLALEDSESFLKELEQYEHVRVVVCGHIHMALDRYHKHIRIIGTPSTCFQFKGDVEHFEIDPVAPGYRYFILDDEGGFETEVRRVDNARCEEAKA